MQHKTSTDIRYFDLTFYGLSQKTLQHKTSTYLRYFYLTFIWTVTEDIAAQVFYKPQIFGYNPFMDCHRRHCSTRLLSISNGFVSSKIYDKRDDFDFDIVNYPFLDGDVPRRPSYGVYISQLKRFARVCSHVNDFNTRNKCLTA